jgi:uracil-DNA glycosylase
MEAEGIGSMARTQRSVEHRQADPAEWLELARSGRAALESVRQGAEACHACPLWKRGTQTIFGEGPEHPRIALIGEQPGDQEDLAGRPFVGPAGKLLDRALEEAGIERESVYVTNAVKHFKWAPRGKRRIHQRPTQNEVRACKPWLEAELAVLRPEVVICLGATAARSLLGSQFRVSQQQGEWIPSALAARVMATLHPAALLRRTDPDQRAAEYARFVRDLRKARRRRASTRSGRTLVKSWA